MTQDSKQSAKLGGFLDRAARNGSFQGITIFHLRPPRGGGPAKFLGSTPCKARQSPLRKTGKKAMVSWLSSTIHEIDRVKCEIAFHIDGAERTNMMAMFEGGDLLRSARRTWSASYLLVLITNAARQCLALVEASRSSLLSKSVRSSASSRSRSICGTSFTNAGLRVTESITAHKSRPGNFSIVYRIVELNLRYRILASSRRGLLHSQ
jgi:hypothetical protein